MKIQVLSNIAVGSAKDLTPYGEEFGNILKTTAAFTFLTQQILILRISSEDSLSALQNKVDTWLLIMILF